MVSKSKKLFLALMALVLIILSVTPALAQDEQDIVDTAVAAGNFTTLATALTAAGLIDTLKGDGPFTVFAPTDEAFAKLPPGTLDSLLADKEALTAVLTYHVVPGKVMAADVVKLDSAVTVQGEPIAIKVEDGKVILNDSANVTATDIETSNGVIHVIDAVILPPSMTAAATPAEMPATGGELPTGLYSLIGVAALGLVLLAAGLTLRFYSNTQA
jgi:uncharacterized surface protein with fasciclin (FAS1) repeats